MSAAYDSNVIDFGHSFDSLYVRNEGCQPNLAPCATPGDPTEVLLSETGMIAKDLVVFDSSFLAVEGGLVMEGLILREAASMTMTAGTVDKLTLLDSSSATISAGSIDRINLHQFSALLMSGGFAEDGITLLGGAYARLFGGSVAYVRAFPRTTLVMTGGTVRDEIRVVHSVLTLTGGMVEGAIDMQEAARVTIRGGLVGGDLKSATSSIGTLRGGSVGGDLLADVNGTIRILGTNFSVDGTPVPLGPISALCGTLTGTLESGEPLDNPFCRVSSLPCPTSSTG